MQAATSAPADRSEVRSLEESFELLSTQRSKPSPESVTTACGTVLQIRKDIFEHAGWWTKTEFQKDCSKLRSVLGELDLKDIDVENKTRLMPTLCKVYRALEQIFTKIKIDAQLKSEVRSRQGFIKIQCYGLGDELCQLNSLVNLGYDLGSVPNPMDFLLDVKDDVDLTVIEASKADSKQQLEVYKVVKNFVANLKRPEVVRHFSVLQLMQMKIAINTLLANYIFHQSKGLSQAEHIFQELLVANQCVNRILASRDESQYAGVKDDSALGRLMLLKDAISRSTMYSSEFWDNPRHIRELSDYVEIMPSCRQFISDTKSHDVKGLVFLGKDDVNGLALFKWPQSNDAKPKALVVFCYNNETQSAYWNCLQNREAMLGLGGLAHGPVLEPVYNCRKALENLISKSAYANQELNIITAGFGIDGAVAQTLAFLLAREQPKIQTKTYAMGTAPFLDVDAAPTFRDCPNHYALVFRLYQDKMLDQSTLGTLVQKQYSDANFHAIYPLFNRDWFASDMLKRGHDVSIYLGNLQKGFKQPRDLHALYTELKEILDIVGLVKEADLPKALQKYFQKFNNS